VDEGIDSLIPFDSSWVKIYLSFIQLWTGTVWRLRQGYGGKADPHIVEFIGELNNLYRDAASVYCTIHSTTKRPVQIDNTSVALIHVFDPHLNCIPSLHVIIVLVNWAFAEKTLSAFGDMEDENAKAWVDSLWSSAVTIVDSILYMKQHSLACVGASLFFLNCVYPAVFDDDRCLFFVQSLFAESPPDGIQRARDHIVKVYRGLQERPEAKNGSWRKALVEFLRERL
jgi:hypothetical protein